MLSKPRSAYYLTASSFNASATGTGLRATGADIDAVCLGDAAWSLKSCAASVTVDVTNMTDCENDKDDATAVLGKPDGISDYGTFSGYYSLNGRTIIVAFSG